MFEEGFEFFSVVEADERYYAVFTESCCFDVEVDCVLFEVGVESPVF